MPEVAILCELSGIFNCSVDRILDPSSSVLRNMDFDYQFLVRPRIPVADYAGPEWPKSIASASFLTAVKLFFGLEQRRDSKGCQMNDDEEYILQSAITNVCFGYSYAPDQYIHDSFLIYGLDYEIHSRADYTEDEFIALARKQIEHGYPVIIIPKAYTDTIFAAGFSDHGYRLIGLGFLEGDDQKNAKRNFDQLDQYAGWYKSDCDLMILQPSDETMPLAEACANALFRGIKLLSNNVHCGEDKMQGYGVVIYRNWRGLLREENQRDADQIECVFPHPFRYKYALQTLETSMIWQKCRVGSGGERPWKRTNCWNRSQTQCARAVRSSYRLTGARAALTRRRGTPTLSRPTTERCSNSCRRGFSGFCRRRSLSGRRRTATPLSRRDMPLSWTRSTGRPILSRTIT